MCLKAILGGRSFLEVVLEGRFGKSLQEEVVADEVGW
jgi:hypothetical protein